MMARQRILVSIEPELLGRVDAVVGDRARSEFIAGALKSRLAQMQPQDPPYLKAETIFMTHDGEQLALVDGAIWPPEGAIVEEE